MIIEFTQIIALVLLIPIAYSIIKSNGARTRIGKKILYMVIYALVIFAFLIATPRIMGLFNPAKSSSVVYNPSAIAGYKGPITDLVSYIEKRANVVINYLAVNYGMKISYFMVNLLPLYASILDPIWLLPTLPYIAFSSLSNYSPYYEIQDQYATYFVPPMFIAYAMGITRTMHKKRITAISFIISIFYFIIFNSLSPFASPSLWVFISDMHSKIVEYLNIVRELVPNNASILTVNNVFPHYANDINAYVIPLTEIPYNAFIEKLNVTYILITATWGHSKA